MKLVYPQFISSSLLQKLHLVLLVVSKGDLKLYLPLTINSTGISTSQINSCGSNPSSFYMPFQSFHAVFELFELRYFGFAYFKSQHQMLSRFVSFRHWRFKKKKKEEEDFNLV